MNTISRIPMPRHFRRLANALLGVVALSSTTLACAVPTESAQTAPAEATGAESEALANNGPGGDGSTCTSRYQSCTGKCNSLYGGDMDNPTHSPFNLMWCIEICDDIRAGCSTTRFGGGSMSAIQ